MTEHLHNWPVAPVGDLLKRVRRSVDVRADAIYREIGIRSHCKGIFHKPPTTGAKIGSKRVFWVEPDCLILNIVFAWEHAVALTSDSEVGMIASHRFPMYTARNGKMLPEYAWRYFSSARGKYNLQIASPGGAGRNKTLGQDEFIRLRIPVPPIEHQRKAVNALAAADRAISRSEQVIAAKRMLKNALAEQLLTGRRRLPRFTAPWTSYCLGAICNIAKGAGASKADLQTSGIPAIRYGELYTTYDSYIDQVRSFISADGATRSRPIQQGDVLLAGSGEDRKEIGTATAYIGSGPAYAGGDIIIVSPRSSDSLFVAFLLKSMAIRRQFYRRAQGESIVHIYMRDVQSLTVHLPTLEEQKTIATVLLAADREIEILYKKLRALQQVKKGLMQALLNIPVTVSARTDMTGHARANATVAVATNRR